MSAEVAVVGSVNLDLVVAVERLPAAGETVVGGDNEALPGGKGANQAVAAARLGRATALVGRVGGDDAGARLRAGLTGEGVDVTHVAVDESAPTGIALIAVERGGDNAIVVSPGANARVAPADVERAAELLAGARVTLLQHEIPPAAVEAAAGAAGGVVVLNPAPARPVPAGLLARVDVLVPNRGELARLARGDAPPPGGADEVAALAAELVALGGPRAVVVTLGAAGAVAVEAGRAEHVPAPTVEAVDATGAGDAFCGALADALAGGAELVEATRRAVRAASLSVRRRGAQAGMPTAAELR